MKLAPVLLLLTSVGVLSLVTVGGAMPVAAPGVTLTPPCTEAMEEEIPSCPATGCGELGDALLNTAKNRFGAVTSPEALTLDKIRAFAKPDTWDTGSPRDSIASIEGRPVVVMGFLLKAKREGAESCNCGITGAVNTDIHLVLVSKLPDLDDEDEVIEAEAGSVTAEITPRVRQHGHLKWVVKNINDFEGEFVKITGRMMLDTKHIPQAHRLPHERPNKRLKRATSWEVHPVSRFEVCTKTVSKCRRGLGWQVF
jgi:hypothetical protein